jgi:hypothetical protein
MKKNVLREASISDCNLVSSCYSNKGLKIHVAVLFFFQGIWQESALGLFSDLRLFVAMAPTGRQKMKKSSNKVFFAGWIPGITSYTDLRNSCSF